jgi:TolB protein
MTESTYITDRFGDNLSTFFGRQGEIAWAIEQLDRGQRLLMILGLHRIGKTSLLRQLVYRLPKSYLAVYVNAGKADSWDSASPLFQIASEVGRTVRERTDVRIEPPDAAVFAGDTLDAWKAYLDLLTAQLDRRQIVLLIDDAHDSAAEWIRSLHRADSLMILAAESQEHLAETLSGITNIVPSITLGPLDNEPAGALIKALVAPRSQIDPWAVRRVMEMTSHHPYYIHLFCRVLLECCSNKSPLTPPDVEEALRQVLDTPIAEFIVSWESSLPRERVLLAVFGALRGHGGIATQYDLQKSCARYGSSPPLRDIVLTLENLVQRGILEKLGANSYRFTLELFRLWVQHHYTPGALLQRGLWRFRQPGIAGLFSALRQAFAKRRTLWMSLGVIAFILVIVVLQPALWQRSVPTVTPSQATAAETAPTPTTHTVAAQSMATDTPQAVPTMVLPGYDLVLMSRESKDSPWQVYALNSRTGRRLRLTETTSNERTPKWSPDGRRLVLASDRDGNREIYVMEGLTDRQGGTQLVNLTEHKAPDWQPAWSPDGQRVAFSSHRDENWEVYLINADGTGLVRLTEHPESDFSPTWSPDGKSLLFVSRRHGDADLFSIDVESGELTQLTTSELDEYDPAWSPNSEWIAFVTQIGNQSDVFVMRADGSAPVNLTNSAYANDFQPTWTADSERLIFVSYTAADGDHDLYVMERDGSEVTGLTDDDNDNLAPSLRYRH